MYSIEISPEIQEGMEVRRGGGDGKAGKSAKRQVGRSGKPGESGRSPGGEGVPFGGRRSSGLLGVVDFDEGECCALRIRGYAGASDFRDVTGLLEDPAAKRSNLLD